MADPDQKNPPTPSKQDHRPQRGGPAGTKAQERDRSTDEVRNKGTRRPDGGSFEEKHPGGTALDINGPAGGKGKGEHRDQPDRRDNR